MEYRNIIVELKDGIEFITLNRPQVLNALNIETVHELRAAIGEARDSAEVKAVLIHGAGGRAFAAGADISEMHALTPQGGRDMIANGQALMCEIERLPKPVVAALNGYCIGGGFELAMACDIRVAAEDVSFAFPEPTLGIIPGYGGTQRLARAIGPYAAKYYCMTEERISVQRAQQLGLLEKIVPLASLMEEAEALTRKIMTLCPESLAALKQVFRDGTNEHIDRALAVETEAFDRLFSAPARTERMGAFLQRQREKAEKKKKN